MQFSTVRRVSERVFSKRPGARFVLRGKLNDGYRFITPTDDSQKVEICDSLLAGPHVLLENHGTPAVDGYYTNHLTVLRASVALRTAESGDQPLLVSESAKPWLSGHCVWLPDVGDQSRWQCRLAPGSFVPEGRCIMPGLFVITPGDTLFVEFQKREWTSVTSKQPIITQLESVRLTFDGTDLNIGGAQFEAEPQLLFP